MGFLNFKPQIYLSPSDASTIDTFYENLLKRLFDIANTTDDYKRVHFYNEPSNEMAILQLRATVKVIDGFINDEIFIENPLIKLRMNNLDFEEIKAKAKLILENIRMVDFSIDKGGDF
jgi:hypothetical protein